MEGEMNLREVLQKNRSLGYATAGILVLVAVVAIFAEVRGFRGRPPGISSRAYYTTDDTATGAAAVDALFVDDVDRVPPFDHDGKPAYLAIVFVCDDGKVKWVNCLKRFPPAAVTVVTDHIAAELAKGEKPPIDTSDYDNAFAEYKIPGPGPWVSVKDPRADAARRCRLPDNASGEGVQYYVP